MAMNDNIWTLARQNIFFRYEERGYLQQQQTWFLLIFCAVTALLDLIFSLLMLFAGEKGGGALTSISDKDNLVAAYQLEHSKPSRSLKSQMIDVPSNNYSAMVRNGRTYSLWYGEALNFS